MPGRMPCSNFSEVGTDRGLGMVTDHVATLVAWRVWRRLEKPGNPEEEVVVVCDLTREGYSRTLNNFSDLKW